jgi:hypothetical protein
MDTITANLLDQIDSIKEKLTDSEYKTFVDTLSKKNKKEAYSYYKVSYKNYYLKFSTNLVDTDYSLNNEEDRNDGYLKVDLETSQELTSILRLDDDGLKLVQSRMFNLLDRPFDIFYSEHTYCLESDIIQVPATHDNYIPVEIEIKHPKGYHMMTKIEKL